jgi:hypothetical protein
MSGCVPHWLRAEYLNRCGTQPLVSRQISARNSLFVLHLLQPYSPWLRTLFCISDLLLWIIFRPLGHFILMGIKFLSKKMLEATANEYSSDCLCLPLQVYTHLRTYSSTSSPQTHSHLILSRFSFLHTADGFVCLCVPSFVPLNQLNDFLRYSVSSLCP